MNLRAFFVAAIAALAVGVLSTPSQAVDAAAGDGLVRLKSRNFDQFYVRPNADWASYRKIVIDPAEVAFRKGWSKGASVTQRISPDQVTRIADEAASSVARIFAEGFSAQGYEIVTAPGPGVLRLSPNLRDLYVNAPGNKAPGVKSYVKSVGSATLHLEVHDASNGALLARIVDHRKAEATQGSMASSDSNRFWLETMYRRWAATCAKELDATKVRPIAR